jgi:hypothetical protein
MNRRISVAEDEKGVRVEAIISSRRSTALRVLSEALFRVRKREENERR